MVHKGLILVAIPLIFGIGYISLLFSGLLNTSQLIDREFQLKDAIVSHFSTITSSFCAAVGKQMYFSMLDPAWKKYYQVQQKRAVVTDKHLRRILKSEDSLYIPSLGELSSELMQRMSQVSSKPVSGLATTPLLKELQAISKKESRAATQSIDSLRLVLYGGVTLGLAISVLLAIFFCLNITNRLLIIVNNAISLSQGTPLNQPFKGTDEIAELDQLLYKSASEIRELERFKKEMVGVVSHELKSPLTSVGSFLSSLAAGVYGELTGKALDKVNRTYSSVKRLMGLIAELLYLDRLELDMHPESIEIDELLAASIDTVKELSEKSGVEFKIVSPGGTVYADRNRLIQVIVNLLSNAMKFSPQDGIVTLEAKMRDGLFECRVSDQGRGIPVSFRKQIFEPFKQVDASDGTSKKGTGLGLTISRSIVEQHEGKIGVDSEEGKGSTFWFEIPQKRSANQIKDQSDRTELSINSKSLSRQGGLRPGKFRVLYQGLLIIALPLLFQIGFALFFNNMLDGLCKQTEREENSIKVLNALNSATDTITGALGPATAAAYMPFPLSCVDTWKRDVADPIAKINEAIKLSKDNPEQEKEIIGALNCVNNLTAVFERENETHQSKNAFEKMDFNYRKFCFNAYGFELKPVTPEEVAADQAGPISPMEMIGSFRVAAGDYLHSNLYKFLDVKSYLDRAIDRETMISRKEAKQRHNMINNLKGVLILAIAATVGLSVLISFFLMRSISRRLQHIMENTERLAKREPLKPALAGHDEIALLDGVLFETGNRLMELETFKKELVSIVSHELRTPLLSISAALELFDTGMHGEFTEKGKNRLKFAQGETDRLVRLINDLLDIEKMEAGKFVLDVTQVRVADLFETSLSAAAQLAESKQISLETENSDAEATICVDKDRVCQVFINLLSNAIKYSPEGGKITISAQPVGAERIKFSIRDQGRGIPEELRLKIFDRFVQVEKSDATERGGTGLGLPISKAIVEQHGGEIGVDSQLGAGSTFWFTLPIRSVTASNSGE